MKSLSKPAFPIAFYVFNAVGFQLVWLVAIMTGAVFWALLSFGVFATLNMALLFILLRDNFNYLNAVKIIVVCMALGVFFEMLKSFLNVWQGIEGLVFPPMWLLSLWGALACCLHVSFSFLQGRLILCSLLGGLSASFSYFGGSALSPKYELNVGIMPLLVICLIWMFVMPLLVYLAARFPIHTTPSPTALNET